MVNKNGGRIALERYWCIHCGLRFRYKTNKVKHERDCIQQINNYGKYKNVTPK